MTTQQRAETEPVKVAALIYFKEGVDIERVRAWVAKLEAAGHTEGAVVSDYAPAYGAPVWYVP